LATTYWGFTFYYLEKTAKSLKKKAFILTLVLFGGLAGGYLWSIFGNIPYI